jgi:[ribosomal protein S5]-alanine N-acetyltransferase
VLPGGTDNFVPPFFVQGQKLNQALDEGEMDLGKFAFPVMETDRLVLRLLTPEDNVAVFRHFSDEEVTRYMDIPPCKEIGEADEIIKYHLDDSGCRWGVFDKQTDVLMGTCGYHCWVEDLPAKAEIGFDLSRAYWGQGFMSEAVIRVIHFGFDQMGLDMIEATVDPENGRSMRMLGNLGFQREKELVEGLVYFYLHHSGLDI